MFDLRVIVRPIKYFTIIIIIIIIAVIQPSAKS